MPNAFLTVRNSLLSLLQSAAAAIARQQSPAAALGPDGHTLTSATAALATAQQDPTRGYSPPVNTSVSASTCADLQPAGKPRPVPYRCYQALDDFVLTAPNPTLRVGLLSDWGTGTHVARTVLDLLARHQFSRSARP